MFPNIFYPFDHSIEEYRKMIRDHRRDYPFENHWYTTYTTYEPVEEKPKLSVFAALFFEDGGMYEKTAALAEKFDDPKDSAKDYLENRLPELDLTLNASKFTVGVFHDCEWHKFNVETKTAFTAGEKIADKGVDT